jgi:hypothetical protein
MDTAAVVTAFLTGMAEPVLAESGLKLWEGSVKSEASRSRTGVGVMVPRALCPHRSAPFTTTMRHHMAKSNRGRHIHGEKAAAREKERDIGDSDIKIETQSHSVQH